MRTRSASRRTVRAGGTPWHWSGGWLAQIGQLLARMGGSPPRNNRHRRGQPALEALEDRSLPSVSSWVYPGIGDQLIYASDGQADRIPDFSNVGYRSGVVPIPTIPVQATVNPGPGDDTALIQAAIDQVSALPLDASGFRGAVLLTAGEYQIGGHLEIRASGVVLRGQGDSESGTVLRATGTDQRTLIQVLGSGTRTQVPGTEHNIIDKYVPVGARSFQVDSTAGLRVGDTVVVHRPSTANWIQALGMDQLTTPWLPGAFDLNFDRIITRIEGNRITVDAPLVNALDQQYGGGTIYRYAWPGRIENVGIENIRGVSDFVSPTDEAHSRSFIELTRVQNAWVRNVTGRHFVFATVWAQTTSKWVTVRECSSLDPVSIITGDRRYPFLLHGQLGLVRDCYSVEGRHDYATGALTTGPNVFVDSRAEQSYNDSGPHHRWAVGALFDNLNVQPAATGGDPLRNGNIDVENRGNFGPGHGWAGANMVIWNSTTDGGFIVHNPPTAHNWLIGSTGPIEPGNAFVGPHDPGITDSHGTAVQPRSLYYAQLQERLLYPGLEHREYTVGDIDQLAGGDFLDGVAVDPSWYAAVDAQTALPLHGFDDPGSSHWVPFTLNFSLAPNERVIGALLSLGLRAATGDGSSDRIYLDSLGNSATLASLGWAPLSSTETVGRVLDLGSQLALLQDGRLNVALAAGTAIDWAILHLQVAPDFSDPVVTLDAVADATVRDDSADQNFGLDPTLAVGSNGEAFLRFDLSGVSGTVIGARVRLVPTSVDQPGIEQAVAFVSSDNWSETDLTWNNRPASGSGLASWVPEVGTPVEFSVLPQVLDTLSGDQLLSLRLFSVSSSSSGLVEYGAREAAPALRPQLVLTLMTDGPPIISDVADQAISEDTPTPSIVFTVGDAETPAGQLTVTASSSNPALIPGANIVLGGNGASRTVTLTPAANQTGTAVITLTVHDASGRTATDSFELRVVAVNDAPAANSATLATDQDAAVDVDLWSLVNDLETLDSQLRFSVFGAVNGSVTLLADRHTARFTPAPGYTGPASFSYTIADIGHGSDVILHYSFEQPDSSADGVVTDDGPQGSDGALQTIGSGSFAFVIDAPTVLLPSNSRSLEQVENGDGNGARLTRLIAPSELDFNNQDWTFAGWFQRRDSDNDDILFHLGAGDGFGGENELYVILGAGNSSVALHHYAGVANRDVLLSRGGIAPGTWHHVAVVFRALGGGQGTLEFYVDGTLAGSDSDFQLDMSSAQPVVLGGHATATSTTARWFDGKLDDLVLYRSALSAVEVGRLAAGSVGHQGGITVEPVTVNVTVAPSSLKVVSLVPTTTGFTAQLNRRLDTAALNLYDTQAGPREPADATLVGSAAGPLRGSLVLDATGTRLTFVATGGLLLPDTYTVTLRSAAGGFRDTSGNLLDGDSDGTPGDAFSFTFTIADSPSVNVSVPDFARGPGQAVHVPATSTGLPLRLSNSAGVTSVTLTLRYDPTLITLSGAVPGPGVPSNAVVLLDTSTPGAALLTFSSQTPLSAGLMDFVRLSASVPGTAPYAAQQVLDLDEVRVNGVAALDDDGLHVAAYFGDASGNGGYSAADALHALRVAIGLDAGFEAYPLADPVLIADITGNGVLTPTDAARILQEALGSDQVAIPPLPPSPPTIMPTRPRHSGYLLAARLVDAVFAVSPLLHRDLGTNEWTWRGKNRGWEPS